MNQDLAILLAVYNPNEQWLEELLQSLNAQTYRPLRLYVRDDASPDYPLERLREVLERTVTAFPFVLHQNEQNMGSNRTFEALVRDARDEKYIAFCDQDDIWLPDKLKNGVELLENSPLSPTLVCSDMRIINGEGEEIAPNMASHRRRHVFLRGEHLAGTLFTRNFVTGCTIILSRRRALSYLPFPNEAIHDHYIAFRAALDGALDYLSEPQLLYRVYGGNQTGVLTGVHTKEDYFRRRIKVFSDRLAAFSAYAPELPELRELQAWDQARQDNYARKKGGFAALWRLRRCNFPTTLFELVALRLPTPLYRLAVKAVQKRIL